MIMSRKHNHYFKNVAHLQEIDVYRVLDLFEVTDQALGHAIKKLLCAGKRGAGKDHRKDIQEAIDTLQRRLEMQDEDERSLSGTVNAAPVTHGFVAVDNRAYADGWLPWNGQGIPVPLSAIVDVKLRSGDVYERVKASGFNWSHNVGDDNIMFYRPVTGHS